MHQVKIVAATTALGANTETSTHAVNKGTLDEESVRQIAVNQVPVATVGENAPSLAKLAAQSALDSAKMKASEIDLLLHSWTHYQGHDFWSPAHYIANALGAHNAMPIGINQMCNGGAIAISLATDLLKHGRYSNVLITTGDIFPDESFDRWASDFGIAYGDAGTALLLRSVSTYSDNQGPRILDIESRVMSEAEKMHRGDDHFSKSPRQVSDRINVRRTKRAYMQSNDMDAFLLQNRNAVKDIIISLMEHSSAIGQQTHFRGIVMPRVGEKIIRTTYAAGSDDAIPGVNCFSYGADTGHLGAGDLVANIATTLNSKTIRTGDRLIYLSAGAGFTITGVMAEF
mgnify:FL=1